ncbi:unnamed protein product [Allacma fusca]|uniref:ABC transporter domain-containing protein n=1 Tax=Allacma fusca TaxID=39272 RepID=A0A8J2JB62_9HEXA|nr:unnamed protein product [Allacma fusca]
MVPGKCEQTRIQNWVNLVLQNVFILQEQDRRRDAGAGLRVKSIWREITDMEPEMEHTLSPISGASKAGELFAVIGGSGVGKSTLLNILSFRHSSRIHVGGDRCLNGVPVEQQVLQDISVFIPVEESRFPQVTIKEHLIFNVMLRTKFTSSTGQKMTLVDDIMREYGLWDYREEPIGNSEIPRLAMKMLSFATEILSNPSIIFCESPLCNLDCIDAFHVVEVMKKIASKGKIVISTFKQPSTEAFMQFDTVCIMTKGLVAFQGGIQEAITFWEEQGYTCPVNYNPCEFFLLTLRINPYEKEECDERNDKIVYQFKRTQLFKDLETLAHRRRWKTVAMSGLEDRLFRHRSRYRAGVCIQIVWLLKRELSVTFRAFFPFFGRLLLTIILAIFFGMMFWDVELDDNGVRSVSCFFFAATVQNLIVSGHCAILAFGRSFPVLMNENNKRMYRTLSCYLVKNLAEIPACTICPVVFVMISYPMIGIGSIFSEEVLLGCVTFTLATYIATSLGMFFTALSGSILGGLTMTHFDIIHLIFYSGLLLNTQTTLPMVGFVHNISIPYQIIDALMLIQFVKSNRSMTIEPSFGTTVHFQNGSNVMDYYSFNKDGKYWQPLFMLFLAMVIGARVVTFIPLVFRLYLHRKFYPDKL